MLEPYPGTRTVPAGDANIVADEADTMVQANFSKDLPKAQKGQTVTTRPDRHSSYTWLQL